MKKAVTILIYPFSDLNRSLKILFLLFFVIPMFVFLYMLFDMGRQGVSFNEYLNMDISHAVLFLLSLLYFIWAYLLFKLFMMNTGDQNQYIGFTLWAIFFSQLFIGNILFIGMIGMILYTNKFHIRELIKGDFFKKHKFYTLLIFFIFMLEFFCVVMITRN